MGNGECRICRRTTSIDRLWGSVNYFLWEIECPVCGHYLCDDWLFNYERESAKLSAYTRAQGLQGTITVILEREPPTTFEMEWKAVSQVVIEFPKRISERTNRALVNLAHLSGNFGNCITLSLDDYPLFYVENVSHATEEQTAILQQLIDDGVVTGRTVYPSRFQVTAKGWSKVEQFLSGQASRPYDTFSSPLTNILRIENNYAPIQQGTTNSHQTVSSINGLDMQTVSDLVRVLKTHKDNFKLKEDDESELTAELATVEAHLISRRPNVETIKRSLSTIIKLTRGVAEKLAVTEIASYIDRILPFLH